MHSLFVAISLLIKIVSSMSADYQGNATDLFTIFPPDNKFFTSYFGREPSSFIFLLCAQKSTEDFSITVVSTETSVATVKGSTVLTPCQPTTTVNVTGDERDSLCEEYFTSNSTETSECYTVSFSGTPVYIGYSPLKFFASMDNNDTEMYIGSISLRVVRPLTLIDRVYNLTIMILVSLMMLATGNDLNLETIKENFRRPKAPVVALISQFTIMPLLAYGIIWLMGYTGGKALGFFTLGCSPGGGTSNMFAKLFNGDMSLSVTMTTLSTFLSLGMLPFWLYTLGATIPADQGAEKIEIPFLNILQSLAFIVIPLALGVLMKYKLKRVSQIIKRWLNVVFIFGLLFFFVFAIYAKFYIFIQWSAELMLASALLPYGGFLLGGLLAWLCRFEWPLIKTISLETGMQSVAVCVLVVMSVSDQPDNDLAIILPLASTIVAGWPLYLIIPFYLLREKFVKKKNKKLKSEESGEEMHRLDEESENNLLDNKIKQEMTVSDETTETKLMHDTV